MVWIFKHFVLQWLAQLLVVVDVVDFVFKFSEHKDKRYDLRISIFHPIKMRKYTRHAHIYDIHNMQDILFLFRCKSSSDGEFD